MGPLSAAPRWHSLTTGEALARVESRTQGLSEHEAQLRLARYGPNELREARRVSAWRLLLGQFKNVLILILLAATALSVALGHGLESLIIAVIVLLAVALGFVQEYRAERAMESLRKLAAPQASVVRDGVERRLPARDLVPGDVLVLRTGDRVPADARLLEAVNLAAEEAALTGESVAVEKHAEAIAGERQRHEHQREQGRDALGGGERMSVVASRP